MSFEQTFDRDRRSEFANRVLSSAAVKNDMSRFLLIGSFGRGLTLGKTIEEMTETSADFFTDVDLLDKRENAIFPPGNYFSPDFAKIDTLNENIFRKIDAKNWGVFINFSQNKNEPFATFSESNLGISAKPFSRSSEQKIEVMDAFATLKIQEIMDLINGYQNSKKHAAQFTELRANVKNLSLDTDRAELETAINSLKKIDFSEFRSWRRKMRIFLRDEYPKISEKIEHSKLYEIHADFSRTISSRRLMIPPRDMEKFLNGERDSIE